MSNLLNLAKTPNGDWCSVDHRTLDILAADPYTADIAAGLGEFETLSKGLCESYWEDFQWVEIERARRGAEREVYALINQAERQVSSPAALVLIDRLLDFGVPAEKTGGYELAMLAYPHRNDAIVSHLWERLQLSKLVMGGERIYCGAHDKVWSLLHA